MIYYYNREPNTKRIGCTPTETVVSGVSSGVRGGAKAPGGLWSYGRQMPPCPFREGDLLHAHIESFVIESIVATNRYVQESVVKSKWDLGGCTIQLGDEIRPVV